MQSYPNTALQAGPASQEHPTQLLLAVNMAATAALSAKHQLFPSFLNFWTWSSVRVRLPHKAEMLGPWLPVGHAPSQHLC